MSTSMAGVRLLFSFFSACLLLVFVVVTAAPLQAATRSIDSIPVGGVIAIGGQRFTKINQDNQFVAVQPFVPQGFATGMNMEDFTAAMCTSAATPTGTTPFFIGDLIDSRDGKTYTVRKFADGRCWMTTNLRYGGGTDGASDYCAGKTTTRYAVDLANAGATATNGLNPGNGSRTTMVGDCRDPAADAVSTSPCYGNTSCGYMYNWSAALQDGAAYGTNASYAQPEQPLQGICPEGWVLPMVGNGSGTFHYLHTQTGAGSTGFWQDANYWAGVYAGAAFTTGAIDYQGAYGYYWSSTMSNAEFSYVNRIEPVNANNGATYRKAYSVSVRCVRDTVDRVNSGLFTGYWTNWNNVTANASDQIASNIRLREVPGYYKIVAVAFGTTDDTLGESTVVFELDQHLAARLNYSKAEFISDIAHLKSKGQWPILAVGGASGIVTLSSAAAVDNFVNSLIAIIDEYGFLGVDFNVESSVDVDNLTLAIQRLSAHYGPDFVATIPIQTTDFNVNRNGVAQGRFANMIVQLKDVLTMVNIQNYNTGSQYALDGSIVDINDASQRIDFLVSTAMVLIEKGLDEDQVGIGVRTIPYQYGSAVADYATAIEVEAAYKMLQTGVQDPAARITTPRAYPDFQGVMLWTINSDLHFYGTFGEMLTRLD